MTVVGALEISGRGQVANWRIPESPVLGAGGAMDLLTGAKRVIVTTTHTTRDGRPKIVVDTRLPLTSTRVVDLVVTDLAVFAVEEGGLRLVEILDDTHDVESMPPAPRRRSSMPVSPKAVRRRELPTRATPGDC